MKIIHAIPAIGLLFSGVLTDYPKNAFVFVSKPMMATEKVAPTQPSMWASQRTISKGEGFDLHFQTPNPTYLGVLDPKGHFFYLVFPKESSIGQLQPLVDSEDFEQMRALHINTTTLKGDPYTYGVYENQKVFTKSGVYRFVLGDNLHVDSEDALFILKIRYNHKTKTARVLKNDQSSVRVLP